jgi:hypothetical protein
MQNRWLKAFVVASVYVGLAVVSGFAQVILVSPGAVWKYLDNGTDQGTAWVTSGFNDASWSSGPAPLGYSTSLDEAFGTTNNFGPDSANKFATTYYRHGYNVQDASSITNLRAQVRRDDGIIVYLNGTEVFRDNMGPGVINFASYVTNAAPDDGASFIPFSINPALLVSGANVVAAEVHQNNGTSTDLVFDLALVGNPLPTIAITSPTNRQAIASVNVLISGTATPGGPSIRLIEVFANATKIGESTNANFSVLWQGVRSGNYTLTAKITDSSGLSATSEPVEITVQDPPSGTIIAKGSIWKYNDLNTDLGTVWQGLAYNDSTWSSGPGPLGAGDTHIVTTVNFGPSGARYTTIYFRRTFTVSNPATYQGLILRLLRDDGAAVYLNGTLLHADSVAIPSFFSDWATDTADGAEESTYYETSLPSTGLVAGTNVLAVAVKQINPTSTDLGFDLELFGFIDTQAPFEERRIPPATATVRELSAIEILFSENVTGVDANDLLINGEPATNVVAYAPDQYVFEFPPAPRGPVSVAWRLAHGITDLAATPNPFLATSWTYTVDPTLAPPTVIISEFMASNDNTLLDENGDDSDWIELYNGGTVSANLGGWYLTDNTNTLTKWRIPGVTLLPGRFLVIFASGKDRTNVTGQLHTSFTLRPAGEELALVDPNLKIVSYFRWDEAEGTGQLTDVSYGRDLISPDLIGYFTDPTPGEPNSTRGSNFGPEIVFSEPSRTFLNSFALTLTTPADPTAEIRYVLIDNATAASTNYANGMPTRSSTLYTAPVLVSGTVQVRARSFSTSAPDAFPGPVRIESYVKLNQNLANFSSDIPLVLMHNFGYGEYPAVQGVSPDIASIFMVFDTKFGRSSLTNIPDTASHSGINRRGSSTLGTSKRSYTVELWDERFADRDLPVLDMPAESDWVLYGANNFDTHLIHNKLAYDMSMELGQYAARAHMVEVFVDLNGGEVTGPVSATPYEGIYVLSERLKRDQNRVDIDKLQVNQTNTPAITGGYFLKRDRVDSNERSFTAGGVDSIVYLDPDGLEMVTAQWAPQRAYIQGYIISMANAINATGNTYLNYIDEQAWIDHNLLNVIPINVDAFRLSGFFYKPRDQVDRHGQVIKPGKFVMGPVWDYDRSQGSSGEPGSGIGDTRMWDPFAWMGQTAGATPTSGDPGTAFFAGNATYGNPWYTGLFKKIDFWQKYVDRYQELRDGPFDTNHIFAKIDDLREELRNAQAREQVRWSSLTGPRSGTKNVFGYSHTFDGTYQGEINQLKRWFGEHIYFLDTNLLDRPNLSSSGGEILPGFQLTITGPPGSTIYYTVNGTDPRAPGGNPAPGALSAPGVAVVTLNNNAYVFARAYDPNHKNLTGTLPDGIINPPLTTPWSGWRKASFVVNLPPLRITELMYHPLPRAVGDPAALLDDDFEYVEVKNISGNPLNLSGFKLRGGIEFDFPNQTLAPGEHAVVASYVAGFTQRYGTVARVLGQYIRVLGNAGERVILEGPLGEIIHDFELDDRWYPSTDGFGFSLQAVDPAAPVANWTTKAGWRASAQVGGSPGLDNGPGANIPVVLVNEALTHSDLPLFDFIELHNPNQVPVNVGGWYVSDDLREPKYQIPSGAAANIPAGGYLVLRDSETFSSAGGALNPLGFTNRFDLRSAGDEVYLFSADVAGNLTGYIQGYEFGAALNGVSFGRYLTSTGEEEFVAQRQNTPGAANAGPRVGPIVISEIMYHPPDLRVGNRIQGNERDEYIELHNISGAAVPLYDLAAPTNTYRLRDAVDYRFPLGQTLPADGRVLIVPFDPNLQADVADAFRAQYNLSPTVPLYGPYEGRLSNGGESVELVQPDLVVFYQTNRVITGVLIDKVDYDDEVPWPTSADGLGPALQRLVASAYGNDPVNWVASLPTPGAASASAPPPTINVQPVGQTALAFSDVTLSVAATGEGQLLYQWSLNGDIVLGATDSVLQLNRVQPNQGGIYQVVVYNAGGSVLSAPATLTLLIPAAISQHPQSQAVRPGTNVTFTVVATSSSVIRYQWRFNGAPIPGATLPAYTVANVQRQNDGIYDVVLTDVVGPVVSNPARLAVLINPTIVTLATNYTAVQGGTVTLCIEVDGTLPMSYRWRSAFATLKTETLNSYQSFLTFSNVQPPYANTNYTVVMTNAASYSPGVLSPTMRITVLTDSDGDGLPDVWETQYPIAGDPNGDADGDGLTNRQEYNSGTNPTDPNSYLRVEQVSVDGDVNIEFQAAANLTYSVLYRNALEDPAWTKLADVVSTATNRTVVIQDREAVSQRFYRLVTPRQ